MNIPRKRNPGVPNWIYDGGLMLQTAEGIQYATPNGYCTVQTPQNIQERRDPALAERLADQGIQFVLLGGPIGAGMSEDMKEFSANKPLSRALRAKGIRRLLYLNTIGMLFDAPFFAENPRAVEWVQRTQSGERPTYYTNWLYSIPCLNNDEYMAYITHMLRTVMKEMKPDGIFTDNYGYYSYSCFCESCRSKFRDYLNKKYPDPQARRSRFGFSSPLDFVTPPPFNILGNSSPHIGLPESNLILEPLTQEWVRFRCERLGQVTSEFNQIIKGCDSQALFFVNYVYGGAPGINCGVFHGLWPECVFPHTDLISAEVAGPPSVTDSGAIQGRNLLMKVAKSFNIPLSTCTSFNLPLADYKRIYLAEGMAFNTASVNLLGEIKREDPPQWMREYQTFYEKNRNVTGRASTVADCAVLHNFESLSYTYTYPQESLLLCEQSLIQGNITFDIIFDRALDHLDTYRCLFLANVVALTRAATEKIAEYVRAGGSIIATEDTSILNEYMLPWKGEWLIPQKSHLLADVLGFEWPTSGLHCRKIGKGRMAVVAKIRRPWKADIFRGQADQTRVESPLAYASHSYGPAMPTILKLPALAGNHAEILKAVDYALENKRTLKLNGNGPVVGEVTQNENGVFVHLLNWDEEKPRTRIKVSLLAPKEKKIKTIDLVSPDRETRPEKLKFTERQGRIEFIVPKLVCYNLITLTDGAK